MMKSDNQTMQVQNRWPAARCLCLLALCLLLGLAGCGGEKNVRDRLQPGGSETLPAEGNASAKQTPDPNFDPAGQRIGLLIDESDGVLSKAAEHGFLRTAENLGYPAQVYAAASNQEAAALVDQAVADGCTGLLLWVNSDAMQAALAKARAAGVATVAAYYAVEEGSADANLVVDPSDYAPEAARILCETIEARGAATGTIFVTGAENHSTLLAYFQEKVEADYPQYQVSSYEGQNDQNSVNAFVLAHPEMVGVLALEPGSGLVWNEACNQVQAAIMASYATPAPSPQPQEEDGAEDGAEETPTPAPTPIPTPSEEARRYANILLLDYTEQNLQLVRRGVVTGLIGRPFYDSTAQSMAALDRLLRGLPTQTDVVLKTPILRKKDIAKYEGIMEEVQEWFLVTPAPSGTAPPKATVLLTPRPSRKPAASSRAAASPSPSAKSSPASAETTPKPTSRPSATATQKTKNASPAPSPNKTE